jgi:hypothetical protein
MGKVIDISDMPLTSCNIINMMPEQLPYSLLWVIGRIGQKPRKEDMQNSIHQLKEESMNVCMHEFIIK